MFRVANDYFSEDQELHELTVYCLTETIKDYIEDYFEDGYESEQEELLYTKVIVDDLIEDLIPDTLQKEIELVGINVSDFIAKKMAQFMMILNSKEEETPDIFVEYLLAKMILLQSDLEYDLMSGRSEDYTADTVLKKKGQLTKALYDYFQEAYEDEQEAAEMVEEYIMRITKFTCFLGITEPDDESLVCWDWDYAYFDEWGFQETILQLSHGVLATMGGYGEEYTRNIFTSVGEQFPFVFRVK